MALAVIPAIAIAALALGLRLGARPDYRVAVVSGAPRGAGGHALAWQLSSFANISGVEEPVALAAHVEARARGRTAATDVVTNADGIAEIALDLGEIAGDEPISLTVTDAAGAPLASGVTSLKAAGRDAPARQWVAHSRRDGPLALDVALRGGKLVAGHASTAWVRVTDASTGAAVTDAALTLSPDAGLDAARAGGACDAGWTRLALRASAHVVSLSVAATRGALTGTWTGALPVAPGAFAVEVADRAPEGSIHVEVFASGAQSTAYVEVDDEAGRVFASVLALSAEAGGVPRAVMLTPPLKSGRFWIVASSDPSGATRMSGATMAWPFDVGGAASDCDGAARAGVVPQGFPRWIAVEGRTAAQQKVATRRARGLTLGLGSLGVAGVLEAMLLLLGARRTREDLARLAEAADAPALAPSRRLGVLDVVVALLLLTLCLGLLSAFALSRTV